MSSGHWGRVLPAHVRNGFTGVFQHGVVPAGFALSCSVGIAGLGSFLSDCPLLTLAGIALPGLALLLAFLSGVVRVLWTQF